MADLSEKNASGSTKVVGSDPNGVETEYIQVETVNGERRVLVDSLSHLPEDDIVLGLTPGAKHFTKFAYRSDLQNASGEQTIWATSGNFVPMTTASTFTITYNNTTDGSGTTGALTLYFEYVDSSGIAQLAVHTLGGTGSDVTAFSGLGINRVSVSSSGSAQTNTNEIIILETTGATKQSTIPALGGTTQAAIFHTDSVSCGIAKFLFIQSSKGSGGSAPKVLVKAYVFNRAIQTRFEVFRTIIDTQSDTTIKISEPVGFKLSPTDVLYFVADTDTNNTEISLRVSLVEYKT
jgi:hypothetical protein